MAKIQGRLGALKTSTTNGSFTAVNGLIDGTINGSMAEIKQTAHDDGAYETYMTGRKDWTIDAKLHYDEADAGQILVTNAFLNGTVMYWTLYLQSGAGFKIATAQGFVTKHTQSSPNDDSAKLDFTVRITGQLTWTNQ